MLIGGAYWPIKFDMYLLKFPVGSEIPPHTDTLREGKHYRLNFVLKQAREGEVFLCNSPIFETNRVKLFRPDITEHEVSKIRQGNRYVLSIGWVRR